MKLGLYHFGSFTVVIARAEGFIVVFYFEIVLHFYTLIICYATTNFLWYMIRSKVNTHAVALLDSKLAKIR